MIRPIGPVKHTSELSQVPQKATLCLGLTDNTKQADSIIRSECTQPTNTKQVESQPNSTSVQDAY